MDMSSLPQQNPVAAPLPPLQSQSAPQQAGKQVPPPPPAAFSERFVAYIIDALIFLAGAFATVYFQIQHGVAYSQDMELKWRLVWLGIYLVYETIFSCGGLATIGKLLLGIRVRAADGVSPLSLPRSFVRAIGYVVNNATFNIGFLIAFLPQGRGLHDFMAGSRVVRVREKGDFSAGLIFAMAWGVFGLLAAATYYDFFVRPSPSDVRKIAMARKELEKLSLLEELYKKQYGSYTDDLAQLALISSDVQGFQREMLGALAPEPFEIALRSNPDGYAFSATALDSKKTQVVQMGP